ncbi:hypothetical protein KY290_001413 [Solanum tuberosum]|uniref:Uncharacterized protein n=2 Tax=Solanum tuberosum TaxID=4113 RepID=A0ABQ7WPD6_SOLTU|nr:hypothetical protein KY290_001413 [Solanum tuberosum]
MSHQQGDDVDYVVNGYEMEELDDFIDEFQGVDLGGFDSDVGELQGINLDDFDLDVDEFLSIDLGGFDSDADELLMKGKDIQGIAWERVTITKETTRQRKLQCYQNYENIPQSVIHWSSLTCAKTETVNLSEHVASLEKHPKNLSEGFMETQVNTFAVADKLLVACGLQGELIIKYLDKPRVCFCSRPTYDNDSIATAIEITNTISGAIL